jgi:hypothetical protein
VTWSSEQYQESREAANEWINSHAPDFVVECIEEMHKYIAYQHGVIQQRDAFIKDLCEKVGLDPDEIFKQE